MTPLSTGYLVARLERGEKGNELDVLIAIALFEPDHEFASVRANDAGTKLIFSTTDGSRRGERTYWADEWTRYPDEAIRRLRAAANTARAVEP